MSTTTDTPAPIIEPAILLHNTTETTELEPILQAATEQGLTLEPLQYQPDLTFNPSKTYWLYLNDQDVAALLTHVMTKNYTTPLALLPHTDNANARRFFGISSKLADAIKDGMLTDRAIMTDVLICNDQLVLSSVSLGDMVHVRPGQAKTELTFWQHAWSDWVNTYQEIKTLTPQLFTLTTAKNQTVTTAALGILIVPHSFKDVITKSLEANFNFNDGRLNSVIFAPASLMAYGWHWFKAHFLGQRQLSLMTDTYGLIQSSKLTINMRRDIEYYLDDQTQQANQLELEIKADAVNLIAGRRIGELDKVSKNNKETFRVQGLPKDEDALAKTQSVLPLFDQAHEAEYRDLFVELRKSAQTTSAYMTLMVLSTLLATFGLMANSTSVVIGAMILAPLMAPIISLSMGLARGEGQLTTVSLRTLVAGLLLALFSAMIATWLVDIRFITPEIAGRLNPTLLDLGVAVVSGIAGAYAYSKAEVAKTLAGVAIAVALVPPLAVTGIGLGWMDWSVIYGSFLLFITNLVGIAAAAAVTFWVLGFTSFEKARKGFSASTLFVGLIAIPLAFAFLQMSEKSSLTRQLEGLQLNLSGIEVHIENVDVQWATPPTIELNVVSKTPLHHDAFDELASQLNQQLELKPIYRFTPQVAR